MSDSAPPPTIAVTWGGLALGFAIMVVWPFVAVFGLADWLDLDLQCMDGADRGRGARLVELVTCAVSEGPAGWLYLIALAGPFAVLAWWLRRTLRNPRRAATDEAAKPRR